jgi:hypothetical protein
MAKCTSIDVQNTPQNTNDRALKSTVNSGAPEG